MIHTAWFSIDVEYVALSAFLGWIVIYTLNNPRKIWQEILTKAREELAAASELWSPFFDLARHWLYRADQIVERIGTTSTPQRRVNRRKGYPPAGSRENYRHLLGVK